MSRLRLADSRRAAGRAWVTQDLGVRGRWAVPGKIRLWEAEAGNVPREAVHQKMGIPFCLECTLSISTGWPQTLERSREGLSLPCRACVWSSAHLRAIQNHPPGEALPSGGLLRAAGLPATARLPLLTALLSPLPRCGFRTGERNGASGRGSVRCSRSGPTSPLPMSCPCSPVLRTTPR